MAQDSNTLEAEEEGDNEQHVPGQILKYPQVNDGIDQNHRQAADQGPDVLIGNSEFDQSNEICS